KILAVALIPARRKRKSNIKDDKLIRAAGLIIDELKEKYSLSKAETMNIIINELKEKYKLNKKEAFQILYEKQETIPITIFTKDLGALEALTKYMKENLNMSYHEIAQTLGRNDRTVWTAYNKAKSKHKDPLSVKQTSILIPIKIFNNRKLTILESVVLHLHEKGMKYSEISQLLNRDQRNIYTIYQNIVRKYRR
ncbi:MAG: hypothetical protein AABY22_04210, partial [Nanoarchaeota archaeon]